jgi:hypothetical protein
LWLVTWCAFIKNRDKTRWWKRRGSKYGVVLRVNGFCKRSLSVGRVSGWHDVPSITLCCLLRTFRVACSSIPNFNWAKPCHFATPLFQTPLHYFYLSWIPLIHFGNNLWMCPFGTLNQNMFLCIHHKPLFTQVSISIRRFVSCF